VRAELRRREAELSRRVVRDAACVFATCVGAAHLVATSNRGQNNTNSRSRSSSHDDDDDAALFDVVVLDEAAQALEIAAWIPLAMAKRAVLAGDHKQLPPTVKADAAVGVLGRTLFERLVGFGKTATSTTGIRTVLLDTQYRMHPDICEWASVASYGGLLCADASVVARAPITSLTSGEALPALLAIDTAGEGLADDAGDDDEPHSKEHGVHSVANAGEAEVVARHVRRLIRKHGLAPSAVCVIAPYNAQVQALRDRLPPTVEAKTVDGYQGGERDAVVLSLTRSNRHRRIGFLADDRRLNVAVTRAKRHLCVVGDSDTVRTSPMIASLLDHIENKGEYRCLGDAFDDDVEDYDDEDAYG